MKMDDNLQKLIKQTNFKSPYQKAHVGMVYLCNWLENYQQDFFKQYEISAQQFNILRILRGQYPKPLWRAGRRNTAPAKRLGWFGRIPPVGK